MYLHFPSFIITSVSKNVSFKRDTHCLLRYLKYFQEFSLTYSKLVLREVNLCWLAGLSPKVPKVSSLRSPLGHRQNRTMIPRALFPCFMFMTFYLYVIIALKPRPVAKPETSWQECQWWFRKRCPQPRSSTGLFVRNADIQAPTQTSEPSALRADSTVCVWLSLQVVPWLRKSWNLSFTGTGCLLVHRCFQHLGSVLGGCCERERSAEKRGEKIRRWKWLRMKIRLVPSAGRTSALKERQIPDRTNLLTAACVFVSHQ